MLVLRTRLCKRFLSDLYSGALNRVRYLMGKNSDENIFKISTSQSRLGSFKSLVSNPHLISSLSPLFSQPANAHLEPNDNEWNLDRGEEKRFFSAYVISLMNCIKSVGASSTCMINVNESFYFRKRQNSRQIAFIAEHEICTKNRNHSQRNIP